MVFTDGIHRKADFVGEHGLVDNLLQALTGALGQQRRVGIVDLCEGGQSEFHAGTIRGGGSSVDGVGRRDDDPIMSIPKPSDYSKELFTAVVGRLDGAEVKAMFGNLGGFVNGNMFCGLFGDDLGVRLDDANRATLIASGGDEFGPEDRPMREYAAVPRVWLSVDDQNLREWLLIAFDHVSQLPPKT